jgi:Cu2+-exporting ATPase
MVFIIFEVAKIVFFYYLCNEKLKDMEKIYKVEGMMCKNCRRHVEEALNAMDGVKAVVTLDPPQAVVEFEGEEHSLVELQSFVSLNAGNYVLSEL